MQTSVTRNPGKFTQGKPTYCDHNDSLMPLEDFEFGYGAVNSADTDGAARLPGLNDLEVTLSADLVADDVLNGVFKVIDTDGNETTVTIAETYASSHAATVGEVKDQVDAVSGLTLTLSGSNRVLTIAAANDKRLEVTTAFSVTNGGEGTAAATTVKDSSDSIRGVAERDENAVSALSLTYTAPKHTAKTKMMAVLHQGKIAVPTAGSPKSGDPVYCLFEDYTDTDTVVNPRGTFRPNTDSGAAPVILVDNAVYASSKSDGLAEISVNKA